MDKWNIVGEKLSINGMEAKAFKSKNARIEGPYDLGIFFRTYEQRGLVSSELLCEKSCSYSLIIFFEEDKDTELRKKYDPILVKQVNGCSKKVVLIDNMSLINDIDENIEKIFKKIPIECWVVNSNWFIDISGAPIPYFLGFMGYLRSSLIRPKLTLFNPTGKYNKANGGYSFTTGFDRNIWVPRLWGYPDHTLKWMYVFLLGFEGSRNSDVNNLCEPDKVKALLGSPGYYPEYVNEALERNEEFLKEAGLLTEGNSPDLLKADAADPVETWRVLQDIVNEQRGKTNLCFVPLGTKGHAVGSGLCALANGFPSILYHMPRSYNVRDAERGESIWKYEITL
jgi:hypothetical protein